jgi:hypothetical protein
MQHVDLPEGATVIRWEQTPERFADPKGYGDRGRVSWAEGPWQTEPDHVEWRKPGSALPRMIVRNRLGGLCGYVGAPAGHRLHGADMEKACDLRVHGGITFGSECEGHICHVAQPGEPEHVWWLGFDCVHSGDAAPGLRMGKMFEWETYKELGYVIRETESLAAQLEELGGQ